MVESREDRLARLIEEIQDRRNRGERLDREALLEEHEEFREDLEEFLACESFLTEALGDLLPPPSKSPSREGLPTGREPYGEVFALMEAAERPAESVLLGEDLSPATRERLAKALVYASQRGAPGMAAILDVTRSEGRIVVVRERLEGPSLMDLMRGLVRAEGALDIEAVRRRWLDGERAHPSVLDEVAKAGRAAQRLAATASHVTGILSLFIDLADALHQAHQGGQVHGEIHPGRVFRLDDGLRVQGLGFAWMGEGAAPLDRPGWRPEWLAPETVEPVWGPVCYLADVWSLALCLGSLIALRIPCGALTPEACLAARTLGHARLLRELPSGLPDGLMDVLETALRPRTSHRLAGLDLFADGLRRVLGQDIPEREEARGVTGLAGRLRDS
ncbi:MAG TPA: hypothetical protein ENK43_06690 [Planctomycetes bacterium]|nr:hypothetical protein [Planctomycetota bacterium]